MTKRSSYTCPFTSNKIYFWLVHYLCTALPDETSLLTVNRKKEWETNWMASWLQKRLSAGKWKVFNWKKLSHKRSEHRTPSNLVARTLVHNNFTHVFLWGCHTKIQMTVNSFNIQPTIASMFGLASNTENAHWHHYAFPWQHTLISHFSQGYFKLALFETCSSINLSWFSINFTKNKKNCRPQDTKMAFWVKA